MIKNSETMQDKTVLPKTL